jgi:hypothetical protein
MAVDDLVAVEDFGGMDLRADPLQLGLQAAMRAVDVELGRPGIVRARPGFGLAGVVAGLGAEQIVTLYRDREPDAVTGADNGIVAYSTSQGRSGILDGQTFAPLGAQVSLGADANVCFAAFGPATNDYLYAAAKGTTIRRITNLGVWSTPAGMPSAGLIAVTPDFRLVACRGALLGAEQARVWFSDPYAPETWSLGAGGNWVDLRPNDSEQVPGLAVWGRQTFVFKETGFFVFGVPTKDERGEPVFGYREERGVGMAAWASQGCCSTPDGVYFVATDGIYLTRGGPPEKVSAPVDPIWGGVAPLFWNPGRPDGSGARMCWWDGRLVISLGGVGQLVYWPELRRWALWKIDGLTGTMGLAVNPAPSGSTLLAGGATDNLDVPLLQSDPYLPADEAGPCTPVWSSGWMQFGARRTVRRSRVEGTGRAILYIGCEDGILDGDMLQLGTFAMVGSSTPAGAWMNRSRAGRRMRYEIQFPSLGGGFAVERVEHHLGRSRRPDADAA